MPHTTEDQSLASPAVFNPDERAAQFMTVGLGTDIGKAVGKVFKKFRKAKKPKRGGRVKTKGVPPVAGLDALIKEHTELLDVQRRGVRPRGVSREEGLAKVAAGEVTEATVKGIAPGTAQIDVDIVATANIAARAVTNLKGLNKLLTLELQQGIENGPASKALLESLALNVQLNPRFQGVKAEAGRTLGILNDPTQVDVLNINQLTELMSNMRGGVGMPRLNQMITSLKTDDQLAHLTKNLGKVQTSDMLLEYWINALLSGPQTHAVNIMDNIIRTVGSVGERVIAGNVFGPLGKQSDRVVSGEASAMVAGMFSHLDESFRVFHKTLISETPQFSKIELPRRKAITAENFGLTPDSPVGYALDLMGSTVRAPGRLLMASDEFIKSIIYRGEVGAQAWREAVIQSAGETIDGLKLTGAELRARRKQLYGSLRNDPSDAIGKAAQKQALYGTLQNDLGRTGKVAQELISTHKGLKVILPFFRTAVNIGKQTFERVPGLALLSKEFRSELKAGGARRDLALAKQAMGAMVSAYVAFQVMAGNITGSGPSNKAKRQNLEQAGWQANSVRIGDQWVQYKRLGVYGQLIGLIADATNYVQAADSETAAEDITTLIAGITLGVSRNITNNTFMKGLDDFFTAIGDFDNDEPTGKQALDRINSLIGSLEPAILSQVAKNIDPIKRRKSDPTLGEAQALLDVFKSRTPGQSKDMPADLAFFGDEINSEVQRWEIINPLKRKKIVTPDPIAVEIVTNEMTLRMPSKTIEGIDLDAIDMWHYHDLIVLFNSVPVTGGRNLRDSLNHLVTTETYQRGTPGPDGLRTALVKNIIAVALGKAQIALKKGNDRNGKPRDLLNAAIERSREERAGRFTQ